ncbi:MAG: glycosyltransferase [Victivallales bacterium]
MKILFVNTTDMYGGAAVAVSRLMAGLARYYHTENHLIVKEQTYKDVDYVYRTTKWKLPWLIEIALDKFTNKIGLQYQYFPFSSDFILKKAQDLKPDVINLHNVHGGFFAASLLPKLSNIAPIVWTLHDMWSFTGNAVHTFGDESWQKMQSGPNDKCIYPAIGIDTGRWLLRQKKKIYAASNISVVPTSEWLEQLVRKSPVFQGKKISRLPNGIDINVFRPRDKVLCREKAGIPINAKVLMFSAGMLTNNPYKGGRHLYEILDEIRKREGAGTDKIDKHLLILGTGSLKDLEELRNFKIHHVNEFLGTRNEERLSELYAAADLFIYPTKADTFPLVLEEAIACGVPCVAFDVGGCGSLVKEGISGSLVRPFDIKGFVAQVEVLLGNEESRKNLSVKGVSFLRKNYSLEIVARKYYEHFCDVIDKDQ